MRDLKSLLCGGFFSKGNGDVPPRRVSMVAKPCSGFTAEGSWQWPSG